MKINNKAPLVSKNEQFIASSPESVWKTHTDISKWSEWHSEISSVEFTESLETGSQFRWKSGGLAIKSTIQTVEKNKKIVWTGKSIGSQAIHVWKFKEKQNGTLVITEESMEGWLVQILKITMPKFLEKSLNSWLEELKNKVEG